MRPADRHAPLASRALPWLMALAVFVPGHMLGWLVEWVWLATMGAIAITSLAVRRWGGQLLGVDSNVWLLIFIAAGGASAISLLVTMLRGYQINLRDLAEMLRFPIYGLMAAFLGIFAGRWNVRAIDRLMRVALWYALACALIYQFRVPPLYDILSNVIYAEAKVLFGVGYIRIPFPFENPNFLAYFLLLTLAYFMFFRRSYLHIALGLTLLFLTGSRSGWLAATPLALAFAFAELTWYSASRRGVFRFAALLLGILVVAAIVASWSEFRNVARVAELLSAVEGGGVSGVDSARARLTNFASLLEWVERSPVVGWGPARALGLDVADNQFLSWIVAWGVLGLLPILCLGALSLSKLLQISRSGPERAGVLALACGLAVMLGTGDFLENYRLFFITLLFLQTIYELMREAPALSVTTPRGRLIQPQSEPLFPRPTRDKAEIPR